MAARNYTNNAAVLTAVGTYNNTDTSTAITVSVAPTGWTTPCYAAWDLGLATEEVIYVTNITGTTVTATRGGSLPDGTFGSTTQAHTNGAIKHVAAAADYSQANTHIQGTPQSHVGLVITPAAVGSQGLVVKGLASQTANLQEWQNSANTVLASIGSSGNLTVGSGITSAGSQVINAQNGYFNIDVGSPNALGGSAGNTQLLGQFIGHDSNVDYLMIRQNRIAAGTSWNSSCIEIVRKTDATEQASLRFGGPQDGNGIFCVGGSLYEGTNRVYSAANPPPVSGMSVLLAVGEGTCSTSLNVYNSVGTFVAPSSGRVIVWIDANNSGSFYISLTSGSAIIGADAIGSVSGAQFKAFGGLSPGSTYTLYVASNPGGQTYFSLAVEG